MARNPPSSVPTEWGEQKTEWKKLSLVMSTTPSTLKSIAKLITVVKVITVPGAPLVGVKGVTLPITVF